MGQLVVFRTPVHTKVSMSLQRISPYFGDAGRVLQNIFFSLSQVGSKFVELKRVLILFVHVAKRDRHQRSRRAIGRVVYTTRRVCTSLVLEIISMLCSRVATCVIHRKALR